jgi:hypothetical protein
MSSPQIFVPHQPSYWKTGVLQINENKKTKKFKINNKLTNKKQNKKNKTKQQQNKIK